MGLIPNGEPGKILQWYDAGGTYALRNRTMDDLLDEIASMTGPTANKYYLDVSGAEVLPELGAVTGSGSMAVLGISGTAVLSIAAVDGTGSVAEVTAGAGGTGVTFGIAAVEGTGSVADVTVTEGGGGTSVTETFDAALENPPWVAISTYALPNVSGGAAVINGSTSGARRTETFTATQYAWVETTTPGEGSVAHVAVRQSPSFAAIKFSVERFNADDGESGFYLGTALYQGTTFVAEYADYVFIGLDVETTGTNQHRVRVYGKQTSGAAWTLVDTRTITNASLNDANSPGFFLTGGTVPYFAAGDGLMP